MWNVVMPGLFQIRNIDLIDIAQNAFLPVAMGKTLGKLPTEIQWQAIAAYVALQSCESMLRR